MKSIYSYGTMMVLSASLVGCLDSGSKQEASAKNDKLEAVSVVSISEVKLKSTVENCDASNEGAIYFDHIEQSFIFCHGGSFHMMDMRGPKGDKGDSGLAGADGNPGALGPAGANGRDGVDGDGVRLAIRDSNNQIVALLVQYSHNTAYNSMALVKYPNGNMIYVDYNTGKFMANNLDVYYTEPDCTGSAYMGRSDVMGPHTPGRVYTYPYGNSDDNINTVAFKAVEAVSGSRNFKSYRNFATAGNKGSCHNELKSWNTPVRVEVIPTPQSLVSFAPLNFSF